MSASREGRGLSTMLSEQEGRGRVKNILEMKTSFLWSHCWFNPVFKLRRASARQKMSVFQVRVCVEQGGVQLYLSEDYSWPAVKKFIWTAEESDGISRFSGSRRGLCWYKLWHHQRPLVSRELASTSSWHPCSDSQKENVKACIPLHPQSLSMYACRWNSFLHNWFATKQVRLNCFANKEK